MDADAFLKAYASQIADTLERLPWDQISKVVDALHEARLRRVQVFICGNGGSAATASHFVNDLNKGANAAGMPRFRALSLVDNVPLMTAWSNDTSYEQALAEPLRNLARPGDLLIGISCSGNSANVLQAVEYAQEVGMQTIALTGSPGGRLAGMVDLPVVVPNRCTEQVEDVHMFLEHALVSALRDRAQREMVPSLILPDGRGGTRSSTGSRSLARRPAILLDRDGVINSQPSPYVRSWDEFDLLPGSLNALRRLAELDLPIVVVTNQSVVGRGLTDFEVVESINLRLMQQVAAQGGRIDAVAWCPHSPDEACACRKPEPGMLLYASACLDLDLERSYLVGDAASDVAVAMSVGATPILVLTGRGESQRAAVQADWGNACSVLADLEQAAEWIVRQIESTTSRGSND